MTVIIKKSTNAYSALNTRPLTTLIFTQRFASSVVLNVQKSLISYTEKINNLWNQQNLVTNNVMKMELTWNQNFQRHPLIQNSFVKSISTQNIVMTLHPIIKIVKWIKDNMMNVQLPPVSANQPSMNIKVSQKRKSMSEHSLINYFYAANPANLQISIPDNLLKC